MNTLLKIIGILLLLALPAAGYVLYKHPYMQQAYHKKYSAADYRSEIDSIQSQKKILTVSERKQWVITSFTKMYPYWLGTKWDFNGITETPGEGKIACGYFVTTLVRDMGFSINRVKLAQSASEEMIKSLCDVKEIKRFRESDNEAMLKFMKENGENLYIVGLDIHTGFLLNDGKEIYFIHSTAWFPACVVKEKTYEAEVLLQSNYKVIGCLSESEKVWEF